MLRIIGCITDQHDPRLLVLAIFICVFACYTSLSLFERARVAAALRSLGWLAAAGVVSGAGTWSTHFVAMLAFHPGYPLGYAPGMTAVSIVIPIVVSATGFLLADKNRQPLLGGALVGIGIVAMHYTGMAAVRVPADIHWAFGYVAASLVVSTIFAAVSVQVSVGGSGLLRRLNATSLMVLAIAGLHFTGMTAVTFSPDPLVTVEDGLIAPEWLAVAVASVTALIIALGLVGSAIDHHLARRSEAESERLRAHVAEVEAAKRALEATAANLASALEAAAAASQTKSQFLATMSHELRTPLNAIIGFSEILSKEMFGPLGDERYREYAKSVEDSGRHLLALINDILDTCKLDAGQLDLHEEEVELAPIIAAAIRMLRHQLAVAGLSVRQQIADDLPALRADERRVRQVVLNLLSNAMKFTPEGGEIRVAAFVRGGEVVAVIADTGIGIAETDIPKALERFGQVDNSFARKYDGTGLGLPLSKRLMELHGGRLDLESEVGRGTTVTMTFPADRVVTRREAA